MTGTRLTKDAVLDALRERAPGSMHLAEVCVSLGLPKQEREQVFDLLEELSELGLVKQMPGRRFRLVPIKRRPRQARGEVETTGRLTMHVSGFGFVADEGGGLDIFIPPPAVGGALHGDRVRIRARPSTRGREGEVISVLDRGVRRVGGVLRRAGGNVWIDPDDPRLRGPMAVVGTPPRAARPGLQVVADILRYPRLPDEVTEVEVVDVLGSSGITEVEVAKLKLRDGVVEEFPTDVLDEAAALPDRVRPAERKGRVDLRSFDLCTIDPADARDHDDAVWAERLADGGFRVIVAIADVSHYVRTGTAIDREALLRGTSIYLPDRAIPMLPAELSSSLASLVPRHDRLCMAVDMELGPSGGVRSHRFVEGVMRSGASLTYEGVARALGLTESVPRQREAEQRREGLQILLEISRTLRSRRMRRGSLGFELPEARVVLDDKNVEPVDVQRSKKDPGVRQAYELIEEMMLLTNEVVAAELVKRGVPTIFRVHGLPDEAKLLRFVGLADALGHRLDPEAALRPKTLSKLLGKIEGTPHARPLSYLLLRAMQQATYDTKNIGHFALAAKNYLHFTSPIRRYPDLAVHRVVRSVIHGERVDEAQSNRELSHVAYESNRLERRAVGLERDVVDLYRVVLMKSRLGEEFEGTVAGIASHGFYTTFDDPFVDALTPLESLPDDFEMDELGVRLTGRRSGAAFALGDRIRVRLEDVSIERRELVAVPVELPAPAEVDAAPRRKRGKGRGERGAAGPARGDRARRSRTQQGGRSRQERPRKDEPRGRRKKKKGDGKGRK